MKRYYVSVTETLKKVVSVDAESEEDAVDMVRGSYDNCDIILDSDNFTGEVVQVEPDQDFYIDYEKEYGETYQHIDYPNRERNLPTNNQNIIDMKNLGIMDICMIKHGLAALIANEKVTLKIAIKKDDKEQIERSNSYIDEVNSVIRKLNS